MSNVYSFQNQHVLFSNTISNTITSGTNLSLLNTSTTSQIPLIIYQGSLTTTNNVTMNIGVSGTSNNSGIIRFNYNGASSTSNTLQLGLQGQTGLTIDGNNNIITNGTIVSNLSTGTNLSLLNTASSSQISLSILQSSLTTTATSQILLGRENTTNNAGLITYTNNTVSSATNTLSLGLVGSPTSLNINGSGIVSITASSGNTLIVSSTASSSSSVTSNSISTLGGIGVTGQSFFSNNTASTSTTTGAIVVTGGVGIGGNLNVGGNIVVTGFLSGYNDLVVSRSINGPQQLFCENTSTGNSAYSIIGVTNSISGCYLFINSSTRTIDGGVNTATLRNDVGELRLQNASNSSTITLSANTTTFANNVSITGQSSFTNATTSTSSVTGAITSAGGIGISNTTDASSATNGGSFTTAGGMAIAKKLFIGASGVGAAVFGPTTTASTSIQIRSNTQFVELGVVGEANNFATGSAVGDSIVRSTGGNLILANAGVSGSTIGIIINTSNNVAIPGSLSVTGAVSKGSGTFDIQHPLKNDNKKRLIHSFIEGPRCDLIYRGTVKLTNGIAYVNLDTDCVQKPESAMSAGTFEALCANPVKYLHNNNTFDKLRGNISGNILTIVCENNQSNANVDWMVIAERKDTFIKKWDSTNEDGYLITEYTKTT